ncbi:MAG TPA: glycine--tRNA ligase subunit beta [Kofleriaceae bacterium]|nr:glycine--tRNA ligase subunit beta [Kofleriaceae bacterium]
MADRELVFEIGSEEIPARMLARAVAELPGLARARLDAARLPFRDVVALGTPRRLTLVVRGLAERQPDLRERVVGPPAGAAFAADGSPTRAALGFAAKNGVDPSTLERGPVEGKKGDYVIATRFVAGQATAEVLPALLAGLCAALPWPKAMRWGWSEVGFVRPVHWLVALWGDEVVPVAWAGLSAGRTTRGHRFLAPAPLELARAEEYAHRLREAFVIVDPAARKEMIAAELARVERETGDRVRPDAGLLDEVTGLCEYPVAVWGEFDRAFLQVPEEALVTAMRNHQRYFAMETADGGAAPSLANRFVTIAGTVTRDVAVVRAGNERVLASRLSDARFFFTEDLRRDLDGLKTRLHEVVFQAKLGAARSTGDKVDRIVGIVEGLRRHVGSDADVDIAARAAQLCKSDLLTGMVGEFPELQGIMGKHYARHQLAEEPAWHDRREAVALAIEEHYMPRGAGQALPSTIAGALVGIADRIDTLVGCFGTGLEPTGSADPYGLRRAANAILAVDLDLGPGGARHETLGKGRGFPISLDLLIELAAHQFSGKVEITDTDCGELREFFRGRLRTLLLDEGLAAADVDAALGVDFDDVCDARLRARALAAVPAGAREVFKRIANILDDAHGKGLSIPEDVHADRFVAEIEHRLWSARTAVQDRLDLARGNGAYRDMFAILVELQPTVAAFFDKGGVMVMDPDPALRDNRLALLARVLQPFAAIADFRLAAAPAASAAPAVGGAS